MGKKGLADKVRNKQKAKSKQAQNPFEVKINKVKSSVVNRKLQKWEKGLPGVSRSKAVKKRKDTLLRELHHMKKSNLLHDKRFGENDSNLTADEKMVQRFAMEKKKQIRKSDFNLNEEEVVLTHYGQSLAENLQDTIGSESDDDDASKNLKTGDLQFGGFTNDSVSWKDKMKEVIAESKKHKFERQAEKEKTLETTNELDKSWKSIVTTLNPVRDNQLNKGKVSNFMQLFHTLVMSQKSDGATDKLKTEEEKAKEEIEKLKQLEAERIARMKGDAQSSSKRDHTSADDLCDGFAVEKPRPLVSFSIDGANVEQDKDESNEEEEEDSHTDNDSDGTEEENEDEAESGDDSDTEEEEDSEEDTDNYSDLASDTESEAEADGQKKSSNVKAKKADEKLKPILKTPKIAIKPGERMDLPFIIPAPGSLNELKSLLHGHSAEEQAIIFTRLRKCHHPSLAEGNKEKLEQFHVYLLEYFGELFQEESLDKHLVNSVTVNLWEMTQMFPVSTANCLQKIIVDRQNLYASMAQSKGGRGSFVRLDTMMYLMLVELLFPTSDFKHPVTTPAIHFITQILAESPVRSIHDVVAGLFLSSLAIKFVHQSKRYIPEVVTFLHGVLFLAADMSKELKVFPPCQALGKNVSLLKVHQKCALALQDWSISELLNSTADVLNNDQFRCQALLKCLVLVQDCLTLWKDLPLLGQVMKPVQEIIGLLPEHLLPQEVMDKCESIIQLIQASESKSLKVMQPPTVKPVPLKLFEPEIEEFWAGKRKKKGPNKNENEQKRLTHKYKREMKAAIREIKRDNEVLARHQLDTVLQKDADRKRKTKTLLQNLAAQEGDYKAIKKAKY
ncbi:nucleolar protein 14-like [Biomphalaria glabrata]|uniref:Nucleolar protein 14-like n=1 Tax=Biomphalaria glabrata TaxID=6526 RepID=A0A9U8EMU0_BIOGL|nr:nucleolar protein 14-like [Biomphalaria glabrata]XP_013095121.2 nucleolar protein 14-like [Biomphalaria glabrata]XP_013095122.2 nucleolar protein 14-like [Biomphalaria glabrata]KAI8777678.1 nucleolar protein 14 [Biomphalaria glabrata]